MNTWRRLVAWLQRRGEVHDLGWTWQLAIHLGREIRLVDRLRGMGKHVNYLSIWMLNLLEYLGGLQREGR